MPELLFPFTFLPFQEGVSILTINQQKMVILVTQVFSSFPTWEKMFKEDHKFKGMIKTYYYYLPKYCQEKTMNDWLDGIHVVIEYLKDVICLYEFG